MRLRLGRSLALSCCLFIAAQPLAGLAQPPRNANIDQPASVAAIEQALVEAIARAEPSVVAISRSSPAEAAPTGDVFGDLRPNREAQIAPTVAAGVIIDPTGLVLTQYLAVREGDKHTVTTIDGKRHAATIRAADPRSGLAVLAIQPSSPQPASPLQRAGNSRTSQAPMATTFSAIRFSNADKLRKGQFVIAIGNPFAIESDGQPTAGWGIVTNLARKAPPNTNLNDGPGPAGDYRTTLHHLGTLIQTDAKLGWNAGGGALVNLQGELVGLTTTAATIAGHEQPAGYAIPINAAFRRIIDTLKQGREVEYGMLGIRFGVGATESAGRGRVTVGEAFPGSPAARAGLQTGDVITCIANQPIQDIDTIQLAVSIQPPSTTTTLEYERAGKTETATVTLAKLGVAGKAIFTVQPESWRGIRVDYATALDADALFEAISSGTYDPEGCVLVRQVDQQSEAWRAGVREGMFISHVGGRRVTTPQEFLAAAREAGDKLDIRLTTPNVPAQDNIQGREADFENQATQR